MNKLNVKAFGLSLGIIWGGLIFISCLFDIVYFWANPFGRIVSLVYGRFQPTILGSIVGALWGFVYASIFGFLIAYVYNRLVEEDARETEKRIKELAHQIWEKKGRPEGTAEEDWKEAERIIRAKKLF